MSIQLREYQQQAVDKAVAFLTDSWVKYNGIIVIPAGKGKWAVFSNGRQLTNILFQ